MTDPAALDRVTARIRALAAMTTANGCTEAEALTAAGKLAELLDRHDLSLSDAELRQAACVERAYETGRKKRIPLDDCVGAVAEFCGCRVWREKTAGRGQRFVFFGLPADAEAAACLAAVIDEAVRSELGRYKTSAEYQRFPHRDRHLANASFALGMVGSIADRLLDMKAARERAAAGSGRGLVVVKRDLVAAELARLGVTLRTVEGARRMVEPDAYDAGEAAGGAVEIGG